jgi:hypothetical protein
MLQEEGITKFGAALGGGMKKRLPLVIGACLLASSAWAGFRCDGAAFPHHFTSATIGGRHDVFSKTMRDQFKDDLEEELHRLLPDRFIGWRDNVPVGDQPWLAIDYVFGADHRHPGEPLGSRPMPIEFAIQALYQTDDAVIHMAACRSLTVELEPVDESLSTSGNDGGRISDPRLTAIAHLAARALAETLGKP